MRVLVCGGRDFADQTFVVNTLRTMSRDWPWSPPLDEIGNRLPAFTIIAGGATGVDAHAAAFADCECSGYVEFKADWKAHGRAAGPIRNARMLADGKPDLVVAFPGGRGTADMVRRARAAGIEVVEVRASLVEASRGE